MPPVLLHPPFASALMLALFAGLIGGYFLVAHRRDPLGRLAGPGFTCVAVGQLAAASLYVVTTEAVVVGHATERLLMHAALFYVIALAYHFRGNPFAVEARAVAVVSGLIWAVLAAMTVFVLATRPALYPFPQESMLYVAWAGWGVTVCLRKVKHFEREAAGGRPSWLRLRTPHARAVRALMLWFVLLIVPGLFSTLAYQGLLDYPAFYAGYMGLQFAAHVYFMAVFFRHTSEPSAFSVKVVGVSLMAVLAVVGGGSLIVQTPRSLVHDAGIRLPEGRALQLTPGSDGRYAAREQAASFDPAPAVPLPLGDDEAERVALPFGFPFHGQTYHEAWVHDDGLVAFEPVPSLPWSRARRLPEAPVVAPLYADFNPDFGGAVTLARTPDRVVVTWEDVRGLRNLSPSTFEVTLHRDGRIGLTYGRLGLVPTNALRAVHPGGPGAQAVPFPEGAAATIPAGQTLLDDYVLAYRAFAHPREARFVWLLLVSVGAILAIFPLLIRAYVVRPVGALAEGVARMTAGDRDVRVPVLYRDEVGALADGFNRMAEALAEREATLQELNASLEAQVAAQTADLRDANERLRALDEAKSRFFANVSHEFRTPLTLLLGPIEQLLADPALEPERRHTLAAMERSTRRLLALVEQLLDLARLDAGEVTLRPRPADLGAWVDHLVGAFVPFAERHGVTLRHRLRLAHPCRAFDADVLEKIVSNLLANALKFSPPGGRVALRVRDDGPEVVVAVEDEGPGVAPEDAGRLFDRFFQADGAHGGTGLGLALVRELTEACGGTVHVDSTPGVGSLFEVRLPLPIADGAVAAEGPSWGDGAAPPPAAPALERDDHAAGPPPPDAPTVLVVEDHPDLLAFLRRALTPRYRVLVATDGEAAWTLARAERPDLILTDVMMPGLGGHGLVARLKADPDLQHTPVVVLTAKASEDDRVAGLAAGVDDYLFKPFHVETLLARLANVLARHRTLRDHFGQTFRLEASSVEVTPAEKAFLDRVREAVEARMADPALSVEALAEDVGASRRSLERALKAADVTPLAFIRKLRMERAAALLAERYGSVKEVAAAVGYTRAGKFASDFRRVHGLTPSAYVARLGQDEGGESDG